MHIKTTKRYHLIPTRMTIWLLFFFKKMSNNKFWQDYREKGTLWGISGGNLKCCSPYEKQYGDSSENKNGAQSLCKIILRCLRKLKRVLPYDPAIPTMGIYPDKIIIQKDTHTPMFRAALFTTAKNMGKA